MKYVRIAESSSYRSSHYKDLTAWKNRKAGKGKVSKSVWMENKTILLCKSVRRVLTVDVMRYTVIKVWSWREKKVWKNVRLRELFIITSYYAKFPKKSTFLVIIHNYRLWTFPVTYISSKNMVGLQK